MAKFFDIRYSKSTKRSSCFRIHTEIQRQIVQNARRKYHAQGNPHHVINTVDAQGSKLEPGNNHNAHDIAVRSPTKEELSSEEYDALMRTPYISIVRTMVYLGLIPISITKPRMPKLHLTKSTFLYSVFMFLLPLFGTCRIVIEMIPKILDSDRTLDQRLIAFEIAVHVIPVYFIPILWVESSKYCVKPFQTAKYEVLFKSITGTKITWKGLCRYTKVMSVILALSNPIAYYLGYFTMPELGLPFYEGYALMQGFQVHSHLFNGMLTRSIMLSGTADRLLKHFEKVAVPHVRSIHELRSVRMLWTSLRELFDTEDCIMRAFVPCYLYLVFVFTLALYEVASLFLVENYWLAVGQFVPALVYGSIMYLVCINSHISTSKMHAPFIRMLDRISLQDIDSNVREEISLFYSTINAKTCHLTLGEYAVVEKGLFASMLSMVVTYLIVLVQFRQSTLH